MRSMREPRGGQAVRKSPAQPRGTSPSPGTGVAHLSLASGARVWRTLPHLTGTWGGKGLSPRERERDRQTATEKESERGDRPAQEARAACGERTTRPGSGEAEQTLWREDRHVGRHTRNSQRPPSSSLVVPPTPQTRLPSSQTPHSWPFLGRARADRGQISRQTRHPKSAWLMPAGV